MRRFIGKFVSEALTKLMECALLQCLKTLASAHPESLVRIMCAQKTDPELEKSLVEYENFERQLQVLVLQKHQLQLQLNEISLAQEEIKKVRGDVYKSIGSVMVKSSAEDAEKDLKERKELSDMRLSTLAKQEEKLRSSLIVMQKKLQDKMKGYEGN